MEAMREVLRGTLAKSLRGIGDEDRLAAAWTVACGVAMADRGRIVGYDAGIVRIEVADQTWLKQMIALRGVLERELARIAGLPVRGIEFKLERIHNTDQHRLDRTKSKTDRGSHG